MTISINTNPSNQRAPSPDEAVDQQVGVGDFFGITSDIGAQVWHFDGTKAVRAGIPNPDKLSMAALQNGENLRQALRHHQVGHPQ